VTTAVRPDTERSERPRPQTVSVVIPAYNARATLGEQLEALARQQYEGDWEVVVVDNGSTDGTANLASRYAAQFKAITVVDAGSRRGHSAPRNAGAQAARGELLVYCDADDVVAPSWLQAMVDAAPQYDLVGGWLDARPLNDEATQSWHQPWPRDRLRSWLLPCAVSANFAIWADVLADLGGWSADYEAGGEDTELSWRAQLAGYRLGFAPAAVVYYRYRTGIRQMARQAYATGVNSERILGDFGFLRNGDQRGDVSTGQRRGARGASRRALGRAAWLVTRLPYLAGSRRRRGQWISVAAEYVGRLSGAVRYRMLDQEREGMARMRSSRPGRGETAPSILWATRDDTSPHPYLVESCRRAGVTVREVRWALPENGRRPLGRIVTFRGRGNRREHPITLKVVGPRLFMKFARAREDAIIVYELGLVGLYAGLSKLLRRHTVVSLIEGDYRHLGRTGTAAFKLPVRRLAARLVDAFVANNELARRYLVGTLGVPERKIVVGWWLAGLPPDLRPVLPPGAAVVPDGVPLFVYAGRLIPPKGVDLLIEAVAVYRREFGPCRLWVLGEGPERSALAEVARRRQVDDSVAFLGPVDHAGLKAALQASQALVFPTLRDFIGRVAVESLTAGTPVVASPMTGAVETIVQDGVNGIVVDPRDPHALAEAMHRAADPAIARALREGVQRTSAALTPAAGADAITRAIALARGNGHRPASAPSPPERQPLNLRIGELVEVRSAEEILTTLDENGELDGLPFMPEMLAWCGRRLRVAKLALKLCDTITWTGMYRMRNAVHLEGSRCDGQAHDGCQAGCNIYWKEAWLRRVPVGEPESAPPTPRCTLAMVSAATRKPPDPAYPGEKLYSCQATELLRAAPERIPSWDARQYLRDIRSGNAGALAMTHTIAIGLFNEYQDASRRLLPAPLRLRRGRRYPFIEGRRNKTPERTLDLQPGELVRVKSLEEIVATLDVNNANRGMSFDGEMVRYCGREFRVLRRVEQIIDEATGTMLRFKNACIVLEDVTCLAGYHRQCPRGIYPYWREIWLERVE
jgi:glycosyltransferase involved in cell wall biosynthesis